MSRFNRRILTKRIQAAGAPCPYCGTVMTFAKKALEPTKDHMVPLAEGGGIANTVNIIYVCRTCNEEKADRKLLDWMLQLQRSGDRRGWRIAAFMRQLRSPSSS